MCSNLIRKNKNMKKVSAVLSLFVLLSGTSQAALVDRGGGLIYDTDLNITWLKNANLSGGMKSWVDANTWANDLVFGGFSDWRLPNTPQSDITCGDSYGGGVPNYGGNCTGSELGHLFYIELGGASEKSIVQVHNSNYDLFSNIQPEFYWSATSADSVNAWNFYFGFGYQYKDDKSYSSSRFAWAVRDGDVAVAAVPEPGAIWLLGSGLFGLIGVAWRKRK